MSAVSSVSGGTGLYQFLQSVSVNGQSQSAGATSASGATSATDPTSSAASGGSPAVSGHHHHHHGGGGGKGDFSKVESAVTSALQSAQADGTSDPNKVIEDAIAKVFKSDSSSPTSSTSGTSTTGSSSSTGSANATDDSSKQAFLKTLQSYGVDPQQFHQDFLAAIKDAQGGQVDPSTALQSFPPGSSVDTTA